MRTLIAVAFAVLLVSEPVAVQGQGGGGGRGGGRGGGPAEPVVTYMGLSCFETLTAPEFPKAAIQSRIDGAVYTYIQITDQGTIGKYESVITSPWGDAQKLFAQPVEAAIRAAKLRPQCNGKMASIIFRYQFRGLPVASPQATSRREEPNVVWIEAPPASAPAKN
jgi:hypothetical protein